MIKRTIEVKPYMLRQATPDFTFMKVWNNNIPMPDHIMTGIFTKETRGMVFAELENEKSQKWNGWIIKSAIIKDIKKEEIVAPTYCKLSLHITKPIRLFEEYSIFISFDFNTEIINLIKSNFDSRYYHSGEKVWEVPISKLEKVKEIFKNYDITIFDDREKFNTKNLNIQFKTKPYEHQIIGVNYGMTHNCFGLYDEMGLGKALSLDTKIYTPTGYKLMKNIHKGDLVFNRKGIPVKVLAEYFHKNVDMYKITFSDNSTVKCCKDHLWKVYCRGVPRIVDTQWFTKQDQFGHFRYEHFKGKNGSYNYWIDRCEPIHFNKQEIGLHPYIVGALLGDGNISGKSTIGMTSNDNFIIHQINKFLPSNYVLYNSKSMKDINYHLINKNNKGGKHNIKNDIVKELKKLNLIGTTSHTKFIPNIYKYNDINTRLEVVRGLIDTDGYVTKDNLIQYTTVSKQLCDDMIFMIQSLGGLCYCKESIGKYKDKYGIVHRCSRVYTLTIRIDNPSSLVSLPRKKKLLKTRKFKPKRSIVKIEKIKNEDAKCITVDDEESLYVIDNFIVTHNTKQAIDIAVNRKLNGDIKHCLILCGVNGLKYNWKNEIETHSDETAYVLGEDIDNVSNEDKLNKLTEGLKDFFIITNIESLRYSRKTGKKIRKGNKMVDEKVYMMTDKFIDLINRGEIGMIIVDEIHKCRNITSIQGEQLLRLQPKYRIAMTGTPLVNDATDLYLILKWLGLETHNFWAFRNHYCLLGGYNNQQIQGYKHKDELYQRLSDSGLRRYSKDVLDLPEKVVIPEYVEMTEKQKSIYLEAKKELIEYLEKNIDKVKISKDPLSLTLRLRQATGYTGILSSTIQESSKYDRAIELIDEAILQNKKVVVFSNWIQTLHPLFEQVKSKYNAALIDGNVNEKDRMEEINRFQTDDNCKVIFGTTGAMGTGLNLFTASIIIFLDHPWNWAIYDQAVARCYRIGQQNKLTIYNLICKNTIDERVWEIVNDKKLLGEQLVDGKQSSIELLNYLLN